MTPEQYRKIRDGLDARPTLRQLVLFCNHWLPAVPFVCYPVLLVILNVQWFALLQVGSAAALDFMQQIARAILVPSFAWGHRCGRHPGSSSGQCQAAKSTALRK